MSLTMPLFLSHFIWAQSLFESQQEVYKQAMIYQDYQVAKNAVYTMIALEPKRIGLKDTLADVYFQAQDFSQCIKVCNDVLKQNSQQLYVREIKAISLQKLQDIKGAIREYEELYKQSNLLNYGYSLMILQYQMKRYGECEELIQLLFKHAKIETEIIQVSTQFVHQPYQKILLKATLFNMLGVISMDMNKNEQAQNYFEQALKISSNFLLAQNNLQLIKSRLFEQNK